MNISQFMWIWYSFRLISFVFRIVWFVSSYFSLKWSEVAQSCPTLFNGMDCSLTGFSVHGIFQARILEWVAISFSRGSSWPRDWTWVSCIVGRRFTIWATKEMWPANIWPADFQPASWKDSLFNKWWWNNKSAVKWNKPTNPYLKNFYSSTFF